MERPPRLSRQRKAWKTRFIAERAQAALPLSSLSSRSKLSAGPSSSVGPPTAAAIGVGSARSKSILVGGVFCCSRHFRLARAFWPELPVRVGGAAANAGVFTSLVGAAARSNTNGVFEVEPSDRTGTAAAGVSNIPADAVVTGLVASGERIVFPRVVFCAGLPPVGSWAGGRVWIDASPGTVSAGLSPPAAEAHADTCLEERRRLDFLQRNLRGEHFGQYADRIGELRIPLCDRGERDGVAGPYARDRGRGG